MDSKRNGTKEQDEDYVLHSTLNSNGVRVRKRVKLQKKALDALVLVDPPFVPKKLRSALIRRNCQSTTPSSSDSKRNQHRGFRATEMLQNKAEEFNKVEEEVAETKEFNKVEEEVAEVLISISNYMTSSNSTKSNEEVIKLEKKSEAKASSSCSPPLELPEERTMSLFPCNNTVLEKNTSDYITEENTKPELLMKSNESRMNLSNQIGGTHQYLPLNGMSQPAQLDSHSIQKPELGIGPVPVEHKIPTLKHRNGSLLHNTNGKAPNLQFELHSRSHEQMSMPSMSNSVTYPDAVLGRPVIGSTNLNTLPEKLSLSSTDMKRPWNKCTTHVYISHLVKNNQKKEMKLPMPHDNQLKPKNDIFSFTSNAINVSKSDMIHPPSKSPLDLNNPEARNHMHSYDPQKQDSEILGKLRLPFPPNPAVMPFKFSPVPYSSQYQDQLANASNQQAQLQHLPHFISNGQLNQHQHHPHQLIWQAQMARFRPNGMHHSSSSSSSTLPSNHQQPSIFSFIPNFNQQLHQQFVPLPPPSLSSRLSNAESYR